MTQRDFFIQVIADYGVESEMGAFAQGRIEALDKRNASRSSKPSKAQIANEPIKEKMIEVLGGATEPMLGSDLAEACGVSINKISPLAKQIEGVAITEVKVKGKGVRKAYALV